MSTFLQLPNAPCPACRCKSTVKKGKRRNRMRTLQILQCSECLHRFTGAAGKHKTYPPKTILDTISTFNLGYSITDTQRIMRQRFHIDIPVRTVQTWLRQQRHLTTYKRLRAAGRKLFPPVRTIRTLLLQHQQVYRFQIHQPKVNLLLKDSFPGLRQYLTNIATKFPHALFQEARQRSSSFSANLHPPITRKENHATRAAAFVLPTSPSNKKRHETLQRFMIVNDSVTVAVEIPVYLTREDIAYYRHCGFTCDFETDLVTGHIDFLQIRNGFAHILDYKPDANKERHAHVQLTLYALARARRANLPLKNFKCGWFDEKNYFEFFPLQGVRPRARTHAPSFGEQPFV